MKCSIESKLYRFAIHLEETHDFRDLPASLFDARYEGHVHRTHQFASVTRITRPQLGEPLPRGGSREWPVSGEMGLSRLCGTD